MIDLENRLVLDDGTTICHQRALLELLYSGSNLVGTFCSDPRDQEEWESAVRACDSPMQGPTHADGPAFSGIVWAEHWNTPEPYKSMDIREWCLDRCQNSAQKDRVIEEMALFEKNGMMPVMRHLVYCTDTWRKNGVLWGVGRGSSVCSFVLYLIGINRINPFEYGLEIAEWIK